MTLTPAATNLSGRMLLALPCSGRAEPMSGLLGKLLTTQTGGFRALGPREWLLVAGGQPLLGQT